LRRGFLIQILFSVDDLIKCSSRLKKQTNKQTNKKLKFRQHDLVEDKC
jgi:type II secretory pathway component PulL